MTRLMASSFLLGIALSNSAVAEDGLGDSYHDLGAANESESAMVAEAHAQADSNEKAMDKGVEAGAKETGKQAIKKTVAKAAGKAAGNNPVGIFFKTLFASSPAH